MQNDCVLCVGLVCLDIINYCDHYPQEDEDIRTKNQEWRKGGNGANTANVLRLLKRDAELFGTLGSGMETDFATYQLGKCGVDYSNCVIHPECRLPTSYIILNTSTGSRTIVHYRNLPELTHKDFASLKLSKYCWAHLEGRNPSEVLKMVEAIREYNVHSASPITISIELEKKRDSLLPLEMAPDVLFIGKEYASYRGYQSAEDACIGMRINCREKVILVCAWGEKGAAATDSNGQLYSAPSFPPGGGLVDTLGAGDTFNAAVIHSLSSKVGVKDAILFGCRVAGTKCGMDGFDGLGDIDWKTA